MDNNSHQNSHQDEAFFQDLIKTLKKRKLTIFSFIVVFCVLGAIYVFSVTPVYQTEATILIGTKTSEAVTSSNQRFEELDPTNSDYYKTQYAMLQSRSLIRRVIEQLNLLEHKEFEAQEPPLISVGKFMALIESTLVDLGITEPKPEVIEGEDHKTTMLIDDFLDRLVISPVRESHVVHIGFVGLYPPLITEITNAFLEAIIFRNIDRRSKILGGSEKWMQEKLIELKQKMKAAERKLARFRKRNDIIDYRQNREISAQNLSRYQDEIRTVKTNQLRLVTLKELLINLKSDPAGLLHSLPDDIKTTEITRLITDYSEILKELTDITPKFSSAHPQVQILQQKLKSIEETIPSEIDRLISSINIDYRGTVVHEESLKKEMREEKSQIMKLDNEEFTFNSLTDEFESNKILHNDLLKRFKEIDIASFNNESAIQIVDKAEVPYIPVKPKKPLILVLCFIMGFSLGSYYVVLRASTNKSVITVEDVIQQIPYPFLGATGIIAKKNLPLPVVENSNTFLAEEFRTVKTNLMLNGFVEPNKVLMVASSTPREGKTTVLTNLAATFAQDGKRVLVVEADFTRPQIAAVLGTKNKPGLLDVLESPRLFQSIGENHIRGNGKIDKIFLKSSVEGVYVLPRGDIKNGYPDVLNYGIFEKFLDVTRQIFDIVLVDTPPTLAFSYVSIVAQLTDGVMFVIGSGMKDKELIKRTLNKLSASSSNLSFKVKPNGQNGKNGSSNPIHQSKIFGVVLNKVKYQRDEHYMYHRKYFQEYYSTRSATPVKEVSTGKFNGS